MIENTADANRAGGLPRTSARTTTRTARSGDFEFGNSVCEELGQGRTREQVLEGMAGFFKPSEDLAIVETAGRGHMPAVREEMTVLRLRYVVDACGQRVQKFVPR